MDSLVFDTVVGVIFVFAVFAFAVSGVVEGVSRLVGLRAEFLLRGVSSLLDDNTTFDKGWIPKLVKSAEKAQDEATDTAIGDALKEIGDNPQGVLVQVKAALTDARQLVAPWKPVAEAETALVESTEISSSNASSSTRPLLRPFVKRSASPSRRRSIGRPGGGGAQACPAASAMPAGHPPEPRRPAKIAAARASR